MERYSVIILSRTSIVLFCLTRVLLVTTVQYAKASSIHLSVNPICRCHWLLPVQSVATEHFASRHARPLYWRAHSTQLPLVVFWALNEGRVFFKFVPPYVPLKFFHASRVQPSQIGPSRFFSIPGMDVLRIDMLRPICSCWVYCSTLRWTLNSSKNWL